MSYHFAKHETFHIRTGWLRKGLNALEKNNHIFEKDGHLWTTTKRDYFQFLTFLKDYIPQKLPDNMKIRNIAKASQSQTITGKRALYVLKKKVLPFEEK